MKFSEITIQLELSKVSFIGATETVLLTRKSRKNIKNTDRRARSTISSLNVKKMSISAFSSLNADQRSTFAFSSINTDQGPTFNGDSVWSKIL